MGSRLSRKEPCGEHEEQSRGEDDFTYVVEQSETVVEIKTSRTLEVRFGSGRRLEEQGDVGEIAKPSNGALLNERRS